MTKKRKILNICLVVVVMIVCYPMIFLIVGSLMGKAEVIENLKTVLGDSGDSFIHWSLLPNFPTLASYVKILLDTPQFFKMFWNSIFMTAAILLGQIIIALPAAWGFAQANGRLKKTFFTLYIILMLLPFQVLMLPEYLTLKNLNLLDSFLAVILPNVFNTFPVFIMYHFFKNIPSALIEAARIDGASEWRIFTKVALPMSKSGVVSILLLSFIECWNLIEQPLLFLNDKSKWPLSLQLPNITLEQADVAIVSSVITMIFPILLFLAGQEELEQGIAASAVKE